ncbi:Isochorismate hydrolase [Brevibacterium iodinum ATCC 49514]|uniref:Isochorismate hydrolase n=1 Tax=Brevibacterium iodinum ATCC 49514 TaxID=1255616 RepID=A0A2H1KKV4_9MICO|nr:isochorismatase family protein [Brevibacterium iodinum]SMY00351.1 Isochorismate hydrolase [Brevibacterium iodinum ATCC 49514]SUW70206.1 Probable isochorismatase [Brevibacterium iodinum]
MNYKFTTTPYAQVAITDLRTFGPEWALDWTRAALLVHDMQQYFVRALPTEPSAALQSNVNRLVRLARDHGTPVIYSGQRGGMSVEERGLMTDFWGPGMDTDEEDRRLVDSAEPMKHDPRVTKWRYSAFTRTDLAELLLEFGKDQLIVCGIYLHVGILATAIDCVAKDIQCFVIGDATADFNRTLHIDTLEYIGDRCGQIKFIEGDLT